MGKYKLWELAAHSREEVYMLAQEVVADKIRSAVVHFPRDTWDEPDQALVFAVHYAMWNQRNKQPDTSVPPYTHKVNIRVIDALRQAVPKFDSLIESNTSGLNRWSLSRHVYSILSNNQLVMRLGGNNSPRHLIREWPKGFVPRWYNQTDTKWLSMKDRADLTHQDERAKNLAGPVVVTYNLDAIPMPAPTPEAILAYTKKVIAAAKALQLENAELRKKLEALEQSGAYESIVEEIGKMLGTPEE